LTATPAANNSFGGWSGGCTGNSATCQVTMDATKAVTATFTATPVSNGGSRVYMPLVQR
jgi:hypothetical protein